MDLLLVIVLGMLHLFLLGCMMLMVLGILEEMLRIGMQMHKVQLQKLQELKLLELGGLVIYSSLRSYAGHVAVIKAYYPDSGEMLLEDMNYVGKYIVTQRWDNVSN